MAQEPKSKKPGMKLLTEKERSSLAKRAVAGKDIGKKGKMFSRVAESAALKYGSEEAGKRVAAAAMIKARAAKKK
jgi:hypothetical protein